MRKQDGYIHLSASDLSNHLGCRHLTALDQAVAEGRLEGPSWRDPALAVLEQRGFTHEKNYLGYLSDVRGLTVVEIENEGAVGTVFECTRYAMQKGVQVISQATLVSGRWYGRADVLQRVDRPSELGDWSYEVVDTKLASETRGGTILQLCLYSDLLEDVQGLLPEYMHVVSPGRNFEPESYRVCDFMAYYRFVKERLGEAVHTEAENASTYPELSPHCDICRWWSACDRRRREDDHLCLVAGISKLQTKELQSWGITTLQALAGLPLPIPQKPRRGAPESYVKVREQARLQLEGRNRGAPFYELLPIEEGLGLSRLPEPSAGDVFFDIEGDRFAGEGGMEYLFGYAMLSKTGSPHYDAIWALDAEEERLAFEEFVDAMISRWMSFPDMHIYHFAHYEPSALKRLMGRYATREDEVDRLLRAGLFIDLYAVVRQALRASVEHYSIKDMEVFYGFDRKIELAEASAALRVVERALELEQEQDISEQVRTAVASYNEDDCISTMQLRDWLERLRQDLIAEGKSVSRPVLRSGDVSEELGERLTRVRELAEALTRDIPAVIEERTEEQQARWLLAHMLEWHRREEKAPWWEFFRLCDLSDEEMLDERAALSGLKFARRIGGTIRCPVDRYGFPPQDTEVREGDTLHGKDGERIGTAEIVNIAATSIDIKKAGAAADIHPTCVFSHLIVRSTELANALYRLGQWVAEHGVDVPGSYRSARDLLLRRPPRIGNGTSSSLQRSGETTLEAAKRLVAQLDHGVLPIQGPPGSGKTYTGARMICKLIQTGKKVGVTAVSHKVIRNLLEAAVQAGREEGVEIRCVQKVTKNPGEGNPAILETTSNQAVVTALSTDEALVAGGTAWLWARQEFFEVVDVLFLDEAGQMSLANVLAVAQATRSLVLLGDPQQLDQPQQGIHPDGTDLSALKHLLNGRMTIPDDRGLFLAETWRLHPNICSFTSEVFYENRLRSHSGLEKEALAGSALFENAGLWFVPVEHEGSQSLSHEEVEQVGALVESLISSGTIWVDKQGKEQSLTLDDILIVAPYNAQVSAIARRLPGSRVGTVDKFQGQEAPVVIYSMTTSSSEEAPRGMEFLYSLNRLNVATSRARCACILVASPRLFEPECSTPRQMQLANAFCRYRELARTVSA